MGFLSRFLGKVKIIENEGDSPENAVIIETNDHMRLIGEEYKYIARRFGGDAKILNRSLITKDKELYDKFEIELQDGSKRNLFINVTPRK